MRRNITRYNRSAWMKFNFSHDIYNVIYTFI